MIVPAALVIPGKFATVEQHPEDVLDRFATVVRLAESADKVFLFRHGRVAIQRAKIERINSKFVVLRKHPDVCRRIHDWIRVHHLAQHVPVHHQQTLSDRDAIRREFVFAHVAVLGHKVVRPGQSLQLQETAMIRGLFS